MSKMQETAELLKAAEKLLRDKVIGSSEGDARFAGLMVASAMGMAERALRLEQECVASACDLSELAPKPNPFDTDGEALVHLIRAGAMDGADDLFRALHIDAILRTAITRPAFVLERERKKAGLE